MKNFLSFCALYFALCIGVVFGYTSEDLSNAQYLANNTIVVSQNNPALYRLDDTILRQEVIGMALKLKGVSLPEGYTCKKYYTDTTANDWVCRAVELAADNGIISRANTRARPTDKVTRAEALAILLKTGTVSLSEPRRVVQTDGSIWSLYEDLKTLGFTQWQADMLDSLLGCSLINHGDSCEDGASTNQAFARFQPNVVALRSTVFEFATLMMGFDAGDDVSLILDDLSTLIQSGVPETLVSDSVLSTSAIKDIVSGEPFQTQSTNPDVLLVVFSDFQCPFCVRYFQDVIVPMMSDGTQDIALVYKHFPLRFHENAYNWSIESECVRKNLGNQAFFDYIHDRYADQAASFSVLAPSLTVKQIDACRLDASIAQDIMDDQNLGAQYKVFGTPTTLVINVKTGYYETIEGLYSKDTVYEIIQSVKAHL